MDARAGYAVLGCDEGRDGWNTVMVSFWSLVSLQACTHAILFLFFFVFLYCFAVVDVSLYVLISQYVFTLLAAMCPLEAQDVFQITSCAREDRMLDGKCR